MAAKKYTGQCHCGKVKFEATLSLDSVMACNCSICSMRGTLFTFITDKEFTLLAGKGETSEYLFNKKHIHHTFCKTCGILPYGYGKGKDGGLMYAVNARCLNGVDPLKLAVTYYDGKSL